MEVVGLSPWLPFRRDGAGSDPGGDRPGRVDPVLPRRDACVVSRRRHRVAGEQGCSDQRCGAILRAKGSCERSRKSKRRLPSRPCNETDDPVQRRRRTLTGTSDGAGTVNARKSIMADRDPQMRKSTSAIVTWEAKPVTAARTVRAANIKNARRATERFIGSVSQVFWKTCGRDAGSIPIPGDRNTSIGAARNCCRQSFQRNLTVALGVD